jgi:diguanylate cyclase (GGDEF)-like protein/PAS domain S-box-containing protein
MFTWIFFLTTFLFAGYAWLLKRNYQSLLTVADDRGRLIKSAFENTAVGMAVVGLDLKYIDINKAYGDIVGYTREELFQITHKDFIHPEDRELDTPYALELSAGKIDSFRSIKRYIHKEGHIVWAEATVSIVRDEKGKPKYFVTQIQDITFTKKTEEELRESRDQLEILACTDCLTDCLNRRAFILRLQEELERSKRNRSQTAMILVDIDSFKRVNDQFGHLAGDYVLQQFSENIKESIRAYDFIGRYGGEEFIICLPDTSGEDAFLVAERMRSSIETLDIDYQGSNIKITGSFGVACFDYNSSESMDQLIWKADTAMYRAKKHKNTVYKTA